MEPHSKIYPGITGQKNVAVTGTKVIDTGLRELRSFTATMQTDPVAGEENHITWAENGLTPGGTVEVTVKVWKNGNTTTATPLPWVAGDSEVLLSWTAIGDR